MSVGVSFGDRNPLRSNTEKNEEKKKGGKEKRRNLELRQMKKKINRGNHQSFNNHREIPYKDDHAVQSKSLLYMQAPSILYFGQANLLSVNDILSICELILTF